MATKTVRDFYKILVIGQPGNGKTFGFRNLDREATGYINGDDKPPSFGGGAFKYHAKPRKFAGAIKAFEDYSKNPEVSIIILDGLTNIFDMLLDEMRTNFKGFDVWSNYNAQIARFIRIIKAVEKEVIVTGHYEILNVEGEPEKRLKVHGKEHEGRIEAHFTIVFYAECKFKDEKPEYYFRTAGEGLSAKCPPDIFDAAIRLPNDCKMIIEKVVEFANKSAIVVENNDALFS